MMDWMIDNMREGHTSSLHLRLLAQVNAKTEPLFTEKKTMGEAFLRKKKKTKNTEFSFV